MLSTNATTGSRAPIYLLGGGEIGRGETRAIDDAILADATLPGPLVFFPTASGDSDEYVATMRAVFEPRTPVLPVTRAGGREAAIDALAHASVVYLGGGTTQLLLDLVQEWDLLPQFSLARARGAVLAGMSAGAQALTQWYVHDESGAFEIRPGWGIARGTCFVHATADTLASAHAALDAHTAARSTDAVALGERAAWRVTDAGAVRIGPGDAWVHVLDNALDGLEYPGTIGRCQFVHA